MTDYPPLRELLRPVLEHAFGGGVETVELDDSVINDVLDGLISAPIPTRLALVLFLGGSLSMEPQAKIRSTYRSHYFSLEWPPETMEPLGLIDLESEEV